MPRKLDYRCKGRSDFALGRYCPPHDRLALFVAEAVGSAAELAERSRENQDYDAGYLGARNRPFLRTDARRVLIAA
jgi:hypothetical protein